MNVFIPVSVAFESRISFSLFLQNVKQITDLRWFDTYLPEF